MQVVATVQKKSEILYIHIYSIIIAMGNYVLIYVKLHAFLYFWLVVLIDSGTVQVSEDLNTFVYAVISRILAIQMGTSRKCFVEETKAWNRKSFVYITKYDDCLLPGDFIKIF